MKDNGIGLHRPRQDKFRRVAEDFVSLRVGYCPCDLKARYASTRSSVRRRGRRPIRRSNTKRGSPTARRPKRVADMCVSLR
jgi:hypothetical protein